MARRPVHTNAAGRCRTRWRERIAALLEIVGVFITGTIAARLTARALGVPAGGIRDLAPGAPIDYLSLASQTAANLLLRYGIILGLAFLIGWWHRRRTPARYGLTRGALSFRGMVTTGIVLFAAGGLLPRILFLAREHIDLGREPRQWELLSSTQSIEFWVYMAVSSFGLVPVVEELFFRGYVQTRLGEAFGAPAAIAMTALLFTLSHRQYFLLSAMGIGMLLSLLAGSLFAGYTRYRFGTLLPGILAHAIGNVPFRGFAHVIVLVAIVAVLILSRHSLLAHVRNLARMLATRTIFAGIGLALLVIAGVLALAALAPAALLPIGIVTLAVAVFLDARNR